MEKEKLQDNIKKLLKIYTDSVILLSAYVKDIDRAIQKLKADHDNLTEKFSSARDGKPHVDPALKEPGAKTFSLKFDKEELDVIIKVMQLRQGHVSAYPHLVFRMTFVYLIATFDAFLTDVLEVVILNRPEILKSKKQITYDKLLEFGTTQGLIEYLAKREMNELSYKSIKDQSDYYQERFGISLADAGVPIEDLVEIHAVRNVLVHNNGFVNHIFIEQVPTTKYKIGDAVVVDAAYFDSTTKQLKKIAQHLASQLAEKFAKGGV